MLLVRCIFLVLAVEMLVLRVCLAFHKPCHRFLENSKKYCFSERWNNRPALSYRHINFSFRSINNSGDTDLAKSVTALVSNDLESAVSFLMEARRKFAEEGLLKQREELLREVSSRVQKEKSKRTGSLTMPATNDRSRLIILQNEADQLLASVAKYIGTRDFIQARQLLNKASTLLESAGFEARRNRETIIGNLFSSILIEEEREVARKKQEAGRAKEEKIHREIIEQLQSGKDGISSTTATYQDDEAIEQFEQRSGDSSNDYQENDQWDETYLRGHNDLVVLVDNGSSLPQTTLNLRKIARQLSDRIGVKVRILHSI